MSGSAMSVTGNVQVSPQAFVLAPDGVPIVITGSDVR